MNGKQAKRLRRAAIGMAAHMVQSGRNVKVETEHAKPQRPDPVDPNTYGTPEDQSGNVFMTAPSPGKTFKSSPPKPPKRSETEVNRPDTLRGIYRYLKKSK